MIAYLNIAMSSPHENGRRLAIDSARVISVVESTVPGSGVACRYVQTREQGYTVTQTFEEVTAALGWAQ